MVKYLRYKNKNELLHFIEQIILGSSYLNKPIVHNKSTFFSGSVAWEMFKMRVDENDDEKFIIFVKTCIMISSGLFYMRQIQRETRYSINTVTRLFHKIIKYREARFIGNIYCPCGIPITEHKQMCNYRFKYSTDRIKTVNDFPSFYNNNIKVNTDIITKGCPSCFKQVDTNEFEYNTICFGCIKEKQDVYLSQLFEIHATEKSLKNLKRKVNKINKPTHE